MKPESTALSGRSRTSMWVFLGVVMTGLVALNVFTWWIELSVDRAPLIAIEPAFAVMFRYFGPEFSGDSIGFGLTVVIGVVVLTRDRTNRFAWVFGSFSLFWMAGTALTALSMMSFAGRLPEPWGPWLAAAGSAFMLVFTFGTLLLVALFPTGSFPDGRVRPALKIGLVILGLLAVVATFAPGGPPPVAGDRWTIDNPVGLAALGWFDVGWFDVASGIVGLLAIISLVIRYRASGSEVRLQIKWVAAGLVLMTVTAALMGVIDTQWEGYPVMLSLWLMVGAIGVAITKHRLYEIDLVISRSPTVLSTRVPSMWPAWCSMRVTG
jgi:hypothetical protein